MKNPEHTSDPDILQEEYHGTGRTVSALGLGALETKLYALAGVAGGAAVGLAAPETVNGWTQKVKDFSRNVLDRNHDTPGIIAACKRGSAHFVGWVFRAADAVAISTLGGAINDKSAITKLDAHHVAYVTMKKEAIIQRFSSFGNKALAMVTLGGVLGLAGFVAGMFTGAFRGVGNASHGKDQFDRAKKEIKNLRGDKEALTAQLEGTAKELAGLKAEAVKLRAETTPAPVVSQAELAGQAHSPALSAQL